MPTIEELLDFLASRGIPDEWQPAETIESGGGTIPKTSSKGLVRSSTNEIIEVGAFARIMAQYAMRDRAAVRAASTLGGLALDLASSAHKALWDVVNWRIQTGRLYIPHKYVISGLSVSAGTGRSLSIAAGEAVHGGYRRYYDSRPNAIAVPMNPNSYAVSYVLYLDNNGNPYLVEGQTAPEGGLALARITVPAGDTGTTFQGTITDLRTFGNPTLPPVFSRTVSLPNAFRDTTYGVYLHLESAGLGGDVSLVVVSKTRNAFAVEHRGTADDVVVRWMTVYMGVL
ncbi:hypothetical protein [Thermus scotoductus]|uniref:Uncharacterized protein n=1 Tax=Thermus scotoductus TaxID=37636 RepID=A0A430RWE5_THESC|nr:hypothetical protein [Thermus scotoductus]RTH24714.1 hypothetical protein CSW40_08050 [Thermus scotoductus]RTI34909.1 hypothetical protein CSW18_11165 [Thermus scotoductus]